MLIILLSTILFLCYYYVQRKYSYWERLGIPYIKPTFPHGNFKTMNKTENSGFMFQRFYNETKTKGPIAGLYLFLSPAVLINDLSVIKNILIRDFQYFTDRGMFHNEEDDPLSLHLFVISGPKWRKYRNMLTPTFTSGKMKFMFPTVRKVAVDLISYIEKQIKTDDVLEIKDLFGRYTTDVISSVAFGLEPNVIEFPDCQIRAKLDKVFQTPKLKGVARIFVNMFPEMARKLHFKSLDDDVIIFFTELVTSAVEYREKNNIYRKDFLQMLIQLKNQGKLDDAETVDYNHSNLTLKEIIAQAFVFMLAGFETSSSTMSYAFLELGQRLDLQDRARAEVLRVLEKYDGEYTYEALSEMKYVDQIIRETLRLYSPVLHLQRRAEADYKEPVTGITIKKGTLVFIPSFAIQRDPDYFPNPLEFDPERYSDEEVKKRNPLTFLAFGDGPRNCIGLRFGNMQTKIGLAMVLANYKVTLNSKSIVPVEYIPEAFILRTVGGLYVNITKISC